MIGGLHGMVRRFSLLVVAVLCSFPAVFSYTLQPSQDAALVRVWTEQGSSVKYLENPNELLTSVPVVFLALDADNDTVFDRGGVPDADGIIALYPVGMLTGSVYGKTELYVSCSYPGPEHLTIENTYTIVLPAGRCVLKASRDGFEEQYAVSIEANAINTLDIVVTTSKSRILLLILGLLIALGTGGIVAFFLNKKQKKSLGVHTQHTAHDAMLKVLRKEEKQVIEYLRERGPQLAGVVRKDLQIPKTSFHRVLAKLKERDLVTEEEFGNTTRLQWNESFHSK